MGLERQWHHRMAGTRTNALVAAAAAVFSMIGLSMGGENNGRIVGQIVSGIGFLGAGVIFKEGGTIHGLNTAATVWCSAAVGSLSGNGLLPYAAVTAVAVVLTNIIFRPLAYKLRPEGSANAICYYLELTVPANAESQMRALLVTAADHNHMTITSLDSEDLEGRDAVRISASLHTPARNDSGMEQVAGRLSLEAGVSTVRWRVQPRVTQ